MGSFLWFCFGLLLGLGLDFILVLHMIKPLKNRIAKLEAGKKDTQYNLGKYRYPESWERHTPKGSDIIKDQEFNI